MLKQQEKKPQCDHTRSLEATRVARLLLLSLATGCAIEPLDEMGAAELGEEIVTRSAEQGIENGQLRPSQMNGGTVLVRAFGQVPREGLKEEICSGQVISRNTILTAAHCFYSVGYFGMAGLGSRRSRPFRSIKTLMVPGSC